MELPYIFTIEHYQLEKNTSNVMFFETICLTNKIFMKNAKLVELLAERRFAGDSYEILSYNKTYL